MSRNKIIERMVAKLPLALRAEKIGNDGTLFLTVYNRAYLREWLSKITYLAHHISKLDEVAEAIIKHSSSTVDGFMVTKFVAKQSESNSNHYVSSGALLAEYAYRWVVLDNNVVAQEHQRSSYNEPQEVKTKDALLEATSFLRPILVAIPDRPDDVWDSLKHGVFVR